MRRWGYKPSVLCNAIHASFDEKHHPRSKEPLQPLLKKLIKHAPHRLPYSALLAALLLLISANHTLGALRMSLQTNGNHIEITLDENEEAHTLDTRWYSTLLHEHENRATSEDSLSEPHPYTNTLEVLDLFPRDPYIADPFNGTSKNKSHDALPAVEIIPSRPIFTLPQKTSSPIQPARKSIFR